MSEQGSVTKLLQQLRDGDPQAAEGLWRRYFDRMSAAARKRLIRDHVAVSDEEDAAISAFNTFCRRLQGGQLEQIANRNDLWAMLIVLTRRKVTQQQRHLGRQKRGGHLRRIPIGRVSKSDSEAKGWSKIEDMRSVSALRDGLDARCEELLELLPDEILKCIAIRRLEGYSNQEIAAELEIAIRTVERKLSRIRSIWRQELEE